MVLAWILVSKRKAWGDDLKSPIMRRTLSMVPTVAKPNAFLRLGRPFSPCFSFPPPLHHFPGKSGVKDGGQSLASSLGSSRCAGLVLGCQDVIACPALECLTLVEAFRCRSLTFHPRHWGKPCLVWKRTEIAFWALSVVCIICQEVYLNNV